MERMWSESSSVSRLPQPPGRRGRPGGERSRGEYGGHARPERPRGSADPRSWSRLRRSAQPGEPVEIARAGFRQLPSARRKDVALEETAGELQPVEQIGDFAAALAQPAEEARQDQQPVPIRGS